MLGNLPTLADRNFVLGFLLPALSACILFLLFFQGSSWAADWMAALLAKDVTTTAYAIISVWFFAVILLLLNHYIYRAFEGYLPPFKWLPGKTTTRSKIQALQLEALRLSKRFRIEGDAFPPYDNRRYTHIRDVLSGLPSLPGDVMPTRFGNAIKAFETYARDNYGADGVTVWLRLLAVAPKDYLTSVQEARTQVDFPINLSFLSTIFTITCACRFVQDVMLSRHLISHDLGWLICVAFVARVTYLWAVTTVPSWGGLVMAGFDCFLPTLAKQLGYELPISAKDRKEFWSDFSEMVNFGSYPDGSAPFDRAISSKS